MYVKISLPRLGDLLPTYWAIVYFSQFYCNWMKYIHKFLGIFSTGKIVYVHACTTFDPKIGLATFWRFFHKRIWSPWSKPPINCIECMYVWIRCIVGHIVWININKYGEENIWTLPNSWNAPIVETYGFQTADNHFRIVPHTCMYIK
jgi:hypothetical protein